MPPRSAEIIAVGSELLGSTRTDTNSLYIAGRLAELGILLRAKAVVGDDRGDLSRIFRQALTRSDVVVLTGGLGPTDDDVTREVIAAALGRPLTIDETIVEKIRERFSKRGLDMPAINRRQGQVPSGATVLENPRGSAPGLWLSEGDKAIVLLPGPPREMQPMFDALCRGPLLALAGDIRRFQRQLFVAGRSESHVEQRVQPIYAGWRDETPPITTTILAGAGQIELHLSLFDRDGAAARQRLDAARDALAAVLGDDVYTIGGASLEEVVGARLQQRHLTIAAAESCIGGFFTSRLTEVPGSSAYVLGSVVAYGNEQKIALLGVDPRLLAAHGAVSEPVSVAMADGIRDRTGADVAVGITGIAGPGGGTPEKPVGTVVIAVLVPNAPVHVRTHAFAGTREQIKYQSVNAALDRVRRLLS